MGIRQRFSPACKRNKVERMCRASGRLGNKNDAPVTVWTSPRDPKNDKKVAYLKENSGLEILLLLGIFTHNFKSNSRVVTCDCHGEFRKLTFSFNERRQSAWIGLHRNVSTKIKDALIYKYNRLTSGPP